MKSYNKIRNASDFFSVTIKDDELKAIVREKNKAHPYIVIKGNAHDVEVWKKLFFLAKEILGISFSDITEKPLGEERWW